MNANDNYERQDEKDNSKRRKREDTVALKAKLERGDSECRKPRMYGGAECQDCKEMMKRGICPSVACRCNPQPAERV